MEIQRSRFLTRLARVETEEAAREIIAAVQAEHPRARHHCTAFVLGPDGRIQRSNDDGEPSGTAGTPMLEALNAAELSDVVAVVTRYFGGILLGAGGLTRAYRASVAQAVEAAQPVTRELQQQVTVTCAYEVSGGLVNAALRQGFVLGEAVYGAEVAQDFWVPVGAEEQLRVLAAEQSAGSAVCETGGQAFVDLADAH